MDMLAYDSSSAMQITPPRATKKKKLKPEPPILNRHFNSREIVASLPGKRIPLELAAGEITSRLRREYNKNCQDQFLKAAKKECFSRWGHLVPHDELLSALEKCSIHHKIYTCLGGPNKNENFILINKAVHQRIHKETEEAIWWTQYANMNGVADLAAYYDKLKTVNRVHIDEQGKIFIDIPYPEGKVFIPQLYLFDQQQAARPAIIRQDDTNRHSFLNAA